MIRKTAFLALPLIGGALALLAESCGGRCLLEENCGHTCKTDDDCDIGRLEGSAPLCRPEPDDQLLVCTRPCTDSKECFCACENSPDEGLCTVGRLSDATPTKAVGRWNICRADRPKIAEMCNTVMTVLSTCCPTQQSQIDACATLEQTYPACTAELDALYYCAFRWPTICDAPGVLAPDACATEAAALDQCTGVSWAGLNPAICKTP